MPQINETRGFTFVEILVVLAVMAILSAASFTAFRNVYRSAGERTAAMEIMDALREARNNTLSAQNDMVFGVRIGTSTVTRFAGSSYVLGNASNTVYTFEAGASATGTLVSGEVDVVFKRLTGEPSATGTVFVRDVDNESTTTITIGATGLIQ